jgi:hypothetical protein
MSIVDDGLSIFRAILPPPDDATPQRLRRYRQNIALILGASIAMNVTHIAWACGFLAFAGLPGFVRADDLTLKDIKTNQTQLAQQFQGVQNDQRTIQENQLDGQIQQAREKQCHAIQTSNVEAKAFATDKLQDRLAQYFRLMGHNYFRLPDCSEL